jgi:aminopeptidase YwaD
MRINNRAIYTLLILFRLSWSLSAACIMQPDVTGQERLNQVKKTIGFLASEELAGRKPGEAGDQMAARFIRNQFESLGLQLLYDDGFQKFSLVSSVELGDNNYVNHNDLNFTINTDFLPYSFSGNTNLVSRAVFVGYGLCINSDSLVWNDYSGADVAGKWVIVLKGDPELNNPESAFADYSGERFKVLCALDKGAAGIIFVAGREYSEKDELQGLFYDKNSSTYPVPVIQVTRQVANIFLNENQITIEDAEKQIINTRQPLSIHIDKVINGSADVIQKQVMTSNVAAILRGTDPVLSNECIVIGAHYDHLGLGGPGSGSRMPDTLAVHYGADDNASGVAAVIDIARRAVANGSLKRSLIFAAFGAEEMGLLGSSAFTADPPADLGKVVAMFNFDMVGRLDSASRLLSIGGTLTSLESEEILTSQNQGYFELSMSGEGSGPSDHAAFYMQNIPVFFISTGAHSDYHTPGDIPDKINYEGIVRIVDYIWLVTSNISNRNDPLTFNEAGSKVRRNRAGRLKVTLGIMPDFAGQEKSGLRVDAVTKGKPAQTAGMEKGDIIISINGNKVGNIYDYMNRLNTFEEGQVISIDVLREGNPVVLIVQL